MKHKDKINSTGFTLIEIMISITLFSVIMIIGSGAVLRTDDTYKKTQTLRSIMDNLSFVMEDMARNLRLGSNYQCLTTEPTSPITTPIPIICPLNSYPGIVFNSVDPTSIIIYGIRQDGSIVKSKDGLVTPFSKLTPDEVHIDPTKSGFTVIGALPGPGDIVQPRVIIRLVGTVTYKTFTSSFNLETTVSQRLLDR